MTLETNLFGETSFVGTTAKEVESILTKYPEADVSHFYFLCLLESCPWVAQLPPEKIMELRHHHRHLESYRRRRQEFLALDKEKQKGG